MDEKEGIRTRIYQCLDRMGAFHIFLLSAFITFSLTAGYANSVNVFYTFTPSYHCGEQQDPNDIQWNQCPSDQAEANCTFDPAEKYDSIVTEYSLICNKRYLAALSSTLYFAGVTVGALLFGPLADYIGRKRTLQITTIAHILMGLCIHFEALTPTIAAFIGLRVVQGAVNQGMQTIAYTALIELTPVRYRTLFGVVWEACWSFGMIYVALISTFTYEWRILQLYMLIPTGLGVIATFIIPESMHWQWTRNDFLGIIKSYTTIARKNGDEEFLRAEEEFQRDKDWKKISASCKEKESLSEESHLSTVAVVKTLFHSPILRKHLLIQAFFWFVVTVTYYALTFFVPNLSGDRHQNILIGGGVEMAGYVVLYLSMKKFGRSRVVGNFAILSAALCIVYAVMAFFESWESETKDTIGVVVLLVAKALAISCFCAMYIFTGELIPTICRGTTFGICGFCSRVGSLLAPQLIALTEVVNAGLPMILIGVLFVVAGALMFALPETQKIQIPNTMQDVEELWGKGRKEKRQSGGE